MLVAAMSSEMHRETTGTYIALSYLAHHCSWHAHNSWYPYDYGHGCTLFSNLGKRSSVRWMSTLEVQINILYGHSQKDVAFPIREVPEQADYVISLLIAERNTPFLIVVRTLC